MLSGKFCVGLRDPRGVSRKVLLPKDDHHSYHLDIELGDKRRD